MVGGALRIPLLAAAAAVLLAGCGGGAREWRFAPDEGVRLRDAVSAEAIVRPDGTILLYVNRPRGIEVYRSRDGLRFARASGRLPLGGHPTVVERSRGGLRMYYASESALPYRPSALYSAYSADGLVWWLEDGIRLSDVGFGVMEVVPLPVGGFRLYFNDNRPRTRSRVVSASSLRGLRFVGEPGARLPPPYVDPAVVRLGPDRWLMVVSTIDGDRPQKLHLAESSDGLRWSVEPEPLVDEPGWSSFDPTLLPLGDGRFRMYYTRAETPPAPGRRFELRSGVLSHG